MNVPFFIRNSLSIRSLFCDMLAYFLKPLKEGGNVYAVAQAVVDIEAQGQEVAFLLPIGFSEGDLGIGKIRRGQGEL